MAADQITGFYVDASANMPPGTPPMLGIRVTIIDKNNLPIAKDVIAVLDTGADSNIIDNDFAKTNLELLRKQPVLSGGLPHITDIYSCSIFVEEFKDRIDGECGTGPFTQTRRNYLIILGRNFLRHYDLIVRAYEKEILLRRPAQ